MSCNFNVLIAGMPRVMGVRELLDEWCAWRTECVRRRVYFVMSKKKDKLHLLKGLKRILLDIDKAIRIIRETEAEADVVPNLMIGFGIDQVQAEYVAEIKLRNINKEYILKRVEETSALQDEIEDLEDILARPARVKKIIVTELEDVRKKVRRAAPHRHRLRPRGRGIHRGDHGGRLRRVRVPLPRGLLQEDHARLAAHERGAEVSRRATRSRRALRPPTPPR